MFGVFLMLLAMQSNTHGLRIAPEDVWFVQLWIQAMLGLFTLLGVVCLSGIGALIWDGIKYHHIPTSHTGPR